MPHKCDLPDCQEWANHAIPTDRRTYYLCDACEKMLRALWNLRRRYGPRCT